MTRFYPVYTLGYHNEAGIYVILAVYSRKRDVIEAYNAHNCAEYSIQGREWGNFDAIVMNKIMENDRLIDITE